MASLRKVVSEYRDELRDGIAWVAFWKEGRSWKAECFYVEVDDSISAEDMKRLKGIQSIDPNAVVLNGYYCGHIGEEMNVTELTASVRCHYENGFNGIASFIESYDDSLSPEMIEKAKAAAHSIGLPFSERMVDGDLDPYVFDGSMSVEDIDLWHRLMEEAKEKENPAAATAEPP